MAMIHLPPDFKEFFQLLNSSRVEYLVVGGYAVGKYGYPRATGDIDIWINRIPKNAEKLLKVLEEFGFKDPALSQDLLLKENQVIRMGVPPLRIELITSISGVEFDTCFKNRQLETIEEIPINFISLEDLKKNKIASGRYKDLNDLENLP